MPNATEQGTKGRGEHSTHNGGNKNSTATATTTNNNSNNNNSNNNSNTNTKANGQKKKRQRHRLRNRNKNFVAGQPTAALVNGKADGVAVQLPTSPKAVKDVANNILQTKPTQVDSSATGKPATPPPAKSTGNTATNDDIQMKPSTTMTMTTTTTTTNDKDVGRAPTANCLAGPTEKTRDQIMAEREAKKLAKQAKKTKSADAATLPAANAIDNKTTTTTKATTTTTTRAHIKPQEAAVAAKPSTTTVTPGMTETTKQNGPQVPSAVAAVAAVATAAGEKSREQIKAEREAKKQAKQAGKLAKSANVAAGVPAITQQIAGVTVTESTDLASARDTAEETKKPALTKAERRAIQEAQRAAKAQVQTRSKTPSTVVKRAGAAHVGGGTMEKAAGRVTSPAKSSPSPSKTVKWSDICVRLFNHLESPHKDVNLFVNNPNIHPSISRLGVQYAKRTIVGSNARCIAFLNALKTVIHDFETPPKKEFGRSLEACITTSVDHLQKCRPLAVSVSNAYKHIKHVLTQLPTDKLESELKENLCHFIDTYVENQIGKAAEAISSSMQEKITDGDVILTFGCSSLINFICEEAHRRHVDFRVIVVDSRPFLNGQELLRRLTAKGIPCTYVLINAIGFVMQEATKVLLGAHALLSNGYVMARTGTAQVALVARSFNVPVLVCCETHKFSERYQTDAIVYNELGDPDDLVASNKCCLSNWQAKCKMSPLNLLYDITPPELVTAVVTEVSILPCTSVPVILRIKPTEIGYYS